MSYRGRPVKSVKTGFNNAVRLAGLPGDTCPYSLRHTMARELRRRGVPKWEVSGMLGHLPDGSRTTEDYAEFAPDYLGQAASAIDAVFADVGRAGGRLSRPIVLPVASVRASCVRVDSAEAREALAFAVEPMGFEPTTSTVQTLRPDRRVWTHADGGVHKQPILL